MNIQSGWNALEYTQTTSSAALKSFSGAVTTDLEAVKYNPQLLIALDNNNLSFTTSDTLAVPASFIQIGGYSGTVNLSTDIPGLTVEPASVALSPLSAQSLKPTAKLLNSLGISQQRLDTTLTFKYSGASLYSQAFNIIAKDQNGTKVGGGTGTVNASLPGIAIQYVSPDTIQLLPNNTFTVNINLYGVNGFTSSVDISMSGLPSGVTASRQTVNLNGYLSTSLTLTAGSSPTPGDYTATVTASGSGKTATYPIKISIPKPSVNISVGMYGNAYKNVYQNSTDTLSVNVSSYAGFSGSTVINLTNLPTGVTATSKTVQVSPGTTTTVEVPLTIAADAPLGTTTLTLTSPDLNASTNTTAPTVQLTVYPARVKTDDYTTLVGRASNGVWLFQTSSWNGNEYTYNLGRFTASGKAATASFTITSYNIRYVNNNDGSLIAFGVTYATNLKANAVQIKDDGTIVSLSTSPFQYDDVLSPDADDQGRIWAIQRSTKSSGVLVNWQPSTGTLNTVDSVNDYGQYSGQFAVSPNGKFIIYTNGSAKFLINSLNSSVQKLSISDNGITATVSNDGTVWYSDSSLLKRVNSDGTVTAFNNIPASRIFGFDRQDTNQLWLKTYSGFSKFNVASSTNQATSVPTYNEFTTISGGGFAYSWSDYSQQYSYYVSFVK